MKKFGLLIGSLFLFMCSCENNVSSSFKTSSNHTCALTTTFPLNDSSCIETFYLSIDSFLNPERPRLTDREYRILIPCSMKLIKSGDTTALRILQERFSKRIDKYAKIKGGYRSLNGIAGKTIGEIPCKRSIELGMRLILDDECWQADLGEMHGGLIIIEQVILPNISKEKRAEYRNKISALNKEAYDKGFNHCQLKSYVFKHIKPLIFKDYKNNLLGI